jgi:hypothetical protein
LIGLKRIKNIDMASLNITIKQRENRSRKATIELDADKFEKLAGVFGLFSSDFLKSLSRAEKDIKAGRVKKVKSLKELR